MINSSDEDAVVSMMNGLYDEDPASSPVGRNRFLVTVRYFLDHPDAGKIVLMKEANRIVGYAITIPFWSNEYGGMIIFVDELFVVRDRRGSGIATAFFEELRRTLPWDAVAMLLEVTPDNQRARTLYESLGFSRRSNDTMSLDLR